MRSISNELRTALVLGASLTLLSGCEFVVTADRSLIGQSSGTGGGQGGSGEGGSGEGGSGGVAGSGGAGGAGEGGSGEGGSGGAGGGGGIRCTTPADCPPTGSECIAATCVGNTCGTENAAQGTALPDPTDGDCRGRQCDGAGAAVEAADDGDLPADDGNPCTQDLCDAGTVARPPTSPGSPCATGGTVCDGLGACVECVAPADCPGEDTDCQLRTCMENACGVDFIAADTPLAAQIAGDCREAQCDGAGSVVNSIDDRDIPDDANECTIDVCTAGTPSSSPVPAGEVCSLPDGGFCDGASACVQCLIDADCASGVCAGNACQEPTCTDGVVNGDELGIDCGGSLCAACAAPAVLNLASPGVVAVGGQVVLTGTGFTGTTSVMIGGMSQSFTVDSDTQITLGAVAEATPLGSQDIVVGRPGAEVSEAYTTTVVRLQINELDADTANTPENLEFVEISAGVANVNLGDYTLVFYNGANDLSYLAIRLSATTNADGLLLVGNNAVTPALTFTNGTLQNGEDAVAIYQDAATSFPVGTAVTATRLIDALVYETNDADDTVLLSVLLPAGPARVQVDEGSSSSPETHSVQRCRDGLRDGRAFVGAAPPSPGAPNDVTCP